MWRRRKVKNMNEWKQRSLNKHLNHKLLTAKKKQMEEKCKEIEDLSERLNVEEKKQVDDKDLERETGVSPKRN